ncbi:MoxR-like ATPase [Scopulibacillus darangshiensis]|uniref:MoxR-like ATPase n=2 Tax=Scopulibacillus darangshiensis TaxID=442528 RepID=A0A4R2NQN4_9BACL|nr:MoxR-like ATPase [Scopulibacillus darangshiensis]
MTIQYDSMNQVIDRVIENVEKVLVGKRHTAELAIVALLANGHVLLEDVPGVGKTMLVRAIAKSLGAEFKRIQFTPDLLPSDLTGMSIYNQKEMNFEFRPGPLLANIVLADEINRTSPKTQAALLEGMEEGSVTVDGETRVLPRPFFVMATQNPIEYEGTFPLPEAQLDRFIMKISMGYPTRSEEVEVLNRMITSQPIEDIKPVITIEEVLQLQEKTKEVHVEDSIKEYIVEIITRTRHHHDIYLGVSPRGSLALLKACQAYALINERDYVIPDDVKHLAPYVLGHRLILKPEAKFTNVEVGEVIADVIKRVKVPIFKRGGTA